MEEKIYTEKEKNEIIETVSVLTRCAIMDMEPILKPTDNYDEFKTKQINYIDKSWKICDDITKFVSNNHLYEMMKDDLVVYLNGELFLVFGPTCIDIFEDNYKLLYILYKEFGYEGLSAWAEYVHKVKPYKVDQSKYFNCKSIVYYMVEMDKLIKLQSNEKEDDEDLLSLMDDLWYDMSEAGHKLADEILVKYYPVTFGE